MHDKNYFGIYKGIVVSNKDPEKRGRIKILCPDVLDDTVESAWCDPCVPIAYDNGGDFCIPQIDEAVWVMFIAGDSNYPVYMGGWWSKDKTPLGSNYSAINKTRIISFDDCTITLTHGKIVLNIAEGVGEITVQDKKVTIEGDLVVKGKVTSNDLSVTHALSSESISATSISTHTLTTDRGSY